MNLTKLTPHSDQRGQFVEAFQLPHDGQIAYLRCYANESRGNHYHLRKTEHFLVVAGVMEFAVKDRGSGVVMKAVISADKPLVVTVTPNHTHMLTAIDGDAVCMIWCDEQYNEADNDTYPEEL